MGQKFEKPAPPDATAPKYHTEKGLDWYRANHGGLTEGTVKTAAAIVKYFEPDVKKYDLEVCTGCHEDIDAYCNECHAYVGAKQQPVLT